MRSSSQRGTDAARSASVGALLGLLLLAARVQVASACVLEPVRLHHSDAQLAQVDRAAPEAPVIFEAAAYRRSGLSCGQDICVANNCGDMGGVAIDLDAGDDQTPTTRMGYRIELVAGVIPPALRNLIGVELQGPTPLRLHLSFDDVPSVDATLRVIAIDAAGNESAPSEPFEVGFDGCTLAATGDQCQQDYDADAEYVASGGSLVVSEASAPPVSSDSAGPTLADMDAEAGCSLPGPVLNQSGPNRSGPGRSALHLLATTLLGCFVVRRRRR